MSVASLCFGGGLMLGGLGVEYHRLADLSASRPLSRVTRSVIIQTSLGRALRQK